MASIADDSRQCWQSQQSMPSQWLGLHRGETCSELSIFALPPSALAYVASQQSRYGSCCSKGRSTALTHTSATVLKDPPALSRQLRPPPTTEARWRRFRHLRHVRGGNPPIPCDLVSKTPRDEGLPGPQPDGASAPFQLLRLPCCCVMKR
jgi:hypothetical protein